MTYLFFHDQPVRDAIQHFKLTGEILDCLIVFFQQEGEWLGDKFSLSITTTDEADRVMRGKAHLPESRRFGHDRFGRPVLLTSFRWARRKPAYLPWHGIMGSVQIHGRIDTAAPNLRFVNGHIHISTHGTVSLPQIRWVGADMHIPFASKLFTPHLRRTGESLYVHHSEMPSLRHVGGTLHTCWSDRVIFPKLRSVGMDLEIEEATGVSVPSLETVGGDIILSRLTGVFRARRLRRVGYALSAECTQVIDAPNLRSVGTFLNTSSAPEFFNPELEGKSYWMAHPQAKARWLARQRFRTLMESQASVEI